MRRIEAPTPFLAAAIVLALAGCSSTRTFHTDPAPYSGPAAEIRPTARTHTAVFTTPTGGWRVSLDGVRQQFDVWRAFVTLRAPDPSDIVTQAEVAHAIDTTVLLRENIEVYARSVGKHEEAGSAPYRLAIQAAKSP